MIQSFRHTAHNLAVDMINQHFFGCKNTHYYNFIFFNVKNTPPNWLLKLLLKQSFWTPPTPPLLGPSRPEHAKRVLESTETPTLSYLKKI